MAAAAAIGAEESLPPIISVEPGVVVKDILEDDPFKLLGRYSRRVACPCILFVFLLSAATSILLVLPIGPATPLEQQEDWRFWSPLRPAAPGDAAPGPGGTAGSPDSGGPSGSGAQTPRTAAPTGQPAGSSKDHPAAGATAAAAQGSKSEAPHPAARPQEPPRTTARPAAAPPAAAPPAAPLDATALSPADREAAGLRVFCFAWTPRRKQDELLMPFVRKLFSKCEGHAFFTDEDAPGKPEGFIKVPVARTQRKRTDQLWLYHQNMVGIAPAWTYLFDHGMLEGYDWVINAELDHFFRVAKAKRCIVDHLRVLRNGSKREQKSLDGPVMLSWGNVFVFNQKIVHLMKEQWGRLGKAITHNTSKGMGCPDFTAFRANHEGSCEQDMAYPGLPGALRPPAVKYGPEGCSQTRRTEKGPDLPFACWQDFPLGGGDKNMAAAIHEIALMQGIPTEELARQHCKTRGPQVEKACLSLYRAVDVPIMHNVKTVAVHKAAQEELLP